MAVYQGINLQFWNVWGLDNVGRINPDNNKYFYLKDHLGSIRCVIDQDNSILSAQDYDVWGYTMQNRSWQSENSRYKFTGKERDKDLENNYDYFVYDSSSRRLVEVQGIMTAG